jgi:glycosyltransferase involved in cell wall biosynthesis
MRKVVFFHNNLSRIATDPRDLLSRFHNYLQAAKDYLRDPDLELNLLVGGIDSNIRFDAIKVVRLSRSLLSQYLALRSALYRPGQQVTLIAGDNHLSLLICLFAKAHKTNIRLQISIHTSVSALLNPSNVSGKLKLKFILLSVRFVDNIRVVSDSDLENLRKAIPYFNGQIFVAPVPIEIPKAALHRKPSHVVGMVGRLHSERGIAECPSIFEELRVARPKSGILLIGDGAQRAWLEKQLSGFEPRPEFTGSLKQSDIRDRWPQIHVLLSCAPSESYGMALREALVNGVFVVARKNETTELLQAQFPNVMKIFTNSSEAAILINGFFEKEFSPDMVTAVRQAIKSEQDKYLIQLAKSWFV